MSLSVLALGSLGDFRNPQLGHVGQTAGHLPIFPNALHKCNITAGRGQPQKTKPLKRPQAE